MQDGLWGDFFTQGFCNPLVLWQREGESMLKANLRICFFFLPALWIFACSQIAIQSNKEETIPAPIPACQKNCTREGGLVSHPVYKTWVKYDYLEFKKGFDLVVRTLQSQGH
jgi:hypothetical protein